MSMCDDEAGVVTRWESSCLRQAACLFVAIDHHQRLLSSEYVGCFPCHHSLSVGNKFHASTMQRLFLHKDTRSTSPLASEWWSAPLHVNCGPTVQGTRTSFQMPHTRPPQPSSPPTYARHTHFRPIIHIPIHPKPKIDETPQTHSKHILSQTCCTRPTHISCPSHT